MTDVAVVGAGVAAAGAAFALHKRNPDVEVTVLERSGRLGGRVATRRHGDLVYDYGANYVKPDDDRVSRLVTSTLDADGLVDVGDPIYTFDADGTVSEGRDADEHKWTYESGLAELPRRLFAAAGATVHLETRVEEIRRTPDGWRLLDAIGDSWGPFDAVAVTPPAPVTASLLTTVDGEWSVGSALADAAADVDYRAIWTAVLHYPFELDRPYYALVNTDKVHEVGWLSREECKRGHVPDGESLLVVQANDEWSRAHLGAAPEEAIRDLADAAARLLDDERVREPTWSDHRAWRHALPESGLDPEGRRDAEREGLYLLGDWVAGEGRIHVALGTGLDVGERLAGDLG